MATISVSPIDENTFEVNVDEGGSKSRHKVSLSDDYYQKLSGTNISKEELIEKSFEFLLERESKESILSSFDLPVISRYFPEYEDKIKKTAR